MAATHHYVLIEQGMVGIDKLGPFKSFEERDEAAKETWKDSDQSMTAVYWPDVDTCDKDDPVRVGEYQKDELEDAQDDD